MQSRSNFWLTLHHLVEDIQREGADKEERLERMLMVLEAQQPIILDFYRQNLVESADYLGELTERCRTKGLIPPRD